MTPAGKTPARSADVLRPGTPGEGASVEILDGQGKLAVALADDRGLELGDALLEVGAAGAAQIGGLRLARG
jgi:hypothetical protein